MVQVGQCAFLVVAATRSEHDVPAEYGIWCDEDDVILKVPRCLDDVKSNVRRFKCQHIPLAQIIGDVRIARMASPIHWHVIYSAQFCDAADVVVMAVGAQDRRQFQACGVQKSQDRRSFSWIDDGDMRLIVDGPDVVVAQGGNGSDVQHDRSLGSMPNSKVIANSLSEWFATEQGGYVLAREKAYFDASVSDLFGYNALQLGLPKQDFLHNSRMPLRFTAGNSTSNDVRVCCSELPFDGDSIDLVLLPHVLEFAENPHQIIREVERVLMPEGNLLISGFNPFSLWGMHRALGRRQGYPWRGQFITLPRMKDWLALLGFEVVDVHFTAYAPPVRQRKWLERAVFMEKAGGRWWRGSGGVYFIHAIKRVSGMRLIKPKWNEGLVRKLMPAAPKLNKGIQKVKNDE